MKKSNMIIATLLVVIIILLSRLIYVQEQQEYIQNSVDSTFKKQLGSIVACFSVDLAKANHTAFQECIASIASALALSHLTTYEEDNDLLDVGLHYLYKGMLHPGNEKEVILSQLLSQIAKSEQSLRSAHSFCTSTAFTTSSIPHKWS